MISLRGLIELTKRTRLLPDYTSVFLTARNILPSIILERETYNVKNTMTSQKYSSKAGSSSGKEDQNKSKKEEFEFFFGNKFVFSQFHPAKFTLDGKTYNCMEQYMHHQKALKFKDNVRAMEIMSTSDPKAQKKLGRQVTPFDKAEWGRVCVAVVTKGSLAKYRQNKGMKDALFATYPKTLVEASPRDILWGIGLGSKNIKGQNRATWRGKNLLGETLTKVRNKMMEEEGKIPGPEGSSLQNTDILMSVKSFRPKSQRSSEIGQSSLRETRPNSKSELGVKSEENNEKVSPSSSKKSSTSPKKGSDKETFLTPTMKEQPSSSSSKKKGQPDRDGIESSSAKKRKWTSDEASKDEEEHSSSKKIKIRLDLEEKPKDKGEDVSPGKGKDRSDREGRESKDEEKQSSSKDSRDKPDEHKRSGHHREHTSSRKGKEESSEKVASEESSHKSDHHERSGHHEKHRKHTSSRKRRERSREKESSKDSIHISHEHKSSKHHRERREHTSSKERNERSNEKEASSYDQHKTKHSKHKEEKEKRRFEEKYRSSESNTPCLKDNIHASLSKTNEDDVNACNKSTSDVSILLPTEKSEDSSEGSTLQRDEITSKEKGSITQETDADIGEKKTFVSQDSLEHTKQTEEGGKDMKSDKIEMSSQLKCFEDSSSQKETNVEENLSTKEQLSLIEKIGKEPVEDDSSSQKEKNVDEKSSSLMKREREPVKEEEMAGNGNYPQSKKRKLSTENPTCLKQTKMTDFATSK